MSEVPRLGQLPTAPIPRYFTEERQYMASVFPKPVGVGFKSSSNFSGGKENLLILVIFVRFVLTIICVKIVDCIF
jgi:hypothetical protein